MDGLHLIENLRNAAIDSQIQYDGHQQAAQLPQGVEAKPPGIPQGSKTEAFPGANFGKPQHRPLECRRLGAGKQRRQPGSQPDKQEAAKGSPQNPGHPGRKMQAVRENPAHAPYQKKGAANRGRGEQGRQNHCLPAADAAQLMPGRADGAIYGVLLPLPVKLAAGGLQNADEAAAQQAGAAQQKGSTDVYILPELRPKAVKRLRFVDVSEPVDSPTAVFGKDSGKGFHAALPGKDHHQMPVHRTAALLG